MLKLYIVEQVQRSFLVNYHLPSLFGGKLTVLGYEANITWYIIALYDNYCFWLRISRA